MFGFSRTEKSTLVSRENALPDRVARMPVAPRHAVLGTPMDAPLGAGQEEIQLGMGCFWGAERKLWEQPGVVTTAVGYSGGFTANPTYRDVCSGQTGHAETLRVVFDTRKTSLDALLRVFWESHDPTTGMRQGNDVGTQYRSAIYWSTPEQRDVVLASKAAYDSALRAAGRGPVTTEVKEAPPFFFAEDEHQQYLHKNPDGYCGLQGTGVACPALRPGASSVG